VTKEIEVSMAWLVFPGCAVLLVNGATQANPGKTVYLGHLDYPALRVKLASLDRQDLKEQKVKQPSFRKIWCVDQVATKATGENRVDLGRQVCPVCVVLQDNPVCPDSPVQKVIRELTASLDLTVYPEDLDSLV